MRNEKSWNMLGMILGIAVILLGLMFFGTSGDYSGTTHTDSASFGADFYTYEYKATRAAAQNAAATANNIEELGESLSTYAGWAFVIAGVLIFLHYGKCYFCQPKEIPLELSAPTSPTIPVATVENDEISKYKELLDQGIITQEEFEKKAMQLQSV